MAVAVAAAALSTAAHGQECVQQGQPCTVSWYTSMSFSVAFTLSGGIGGNCDGSQAPCDYTCSFSSTESCGNVHLGSCPGNGSHSCGSGSGNAAWGRFGGIPGVFASTSPWLNGTGTRFITVSLQAVLTVPMWGSLSSAANAAPWTIYTGGDTIDNLSHGYGATRWFRAGETMTLVGTAVGSEFLQWGGTPCQDIDADGVCDTYGNISRNFGDFDASGDVGAPDLATMLDAWGSSGGTNGAIDLDDNGVVGASDLGILLSRWGLGA